MLIEVSRQAEAAAREMLALVDAGGVDCGELREMLHISRATTALLSAAQTSAASIIARSERHGDGGVGVLAEASGLSRRDARGQVHTAETIAAAPSLRDAVESGRVSQANARRLAEVVKKTSAEAVESDAGLLAKAESLRPEHFAREALRWAADHQDDGGEREYQRLSAKRCVHVWDSDDGTVQLHGVFDPVTGKRIGNRLRAEARRMYDTDKKHAANGTRGRDNRGSSSRRGDAYDDRRRNERLDGSDRERHDDRHSNRRRNERLDGSTGERGSGQAGGRRTFEQCMADALDNLTSHNPTSGAGERTNARASTGTGTSLGTGSGSLLNTGPDTNSLPDTDSAPNTGSAPKTGSSGDTGTANDTRTDHDRGMRTAADAGTARDTGHSALTGRDGGSSAGANIDTDPGSATGAGSANVPGTDSATRQPPDTDTRQPRDSAPGTNADTAPGTDAATRQPPDTDTRQSRDSATSTSAGRPFADISVIAHVDDATGKLIAELPDGERLPEAVLEQLACNARLTGLVYDTAGTPIWRAKPTRTATERQRRLLLDQWGGCFHCSAHPDMCQIHHIMPVSQGGATKINNMIPVCWDCHQKIHHQHWQIRKHPSGQHTLHPPNSTHHKPAHTPQQPPLEPDPRAHRDTQTHHRTAHDAEQPPLFAHADSSRAAAIAPQPAHTGQTRGHATAHSSST